MIRINLLPWREEKRKARRQQFYALSGLITVLAGLIWFLGFTIINGYISAQEDTNKYLEAEIAKLDKEIAEINRLKGEINALLERKRIIETLQANRAETVHLFNELARQVPEGVYLRSIKQTGGKINLMGFAQSNARVSTLMRNLDASPLLERPDLVEIKAAQIGNRRLADFNLNITITRQTTAESRPKASPAPKGGKP
ncbi:MAG: fimbrial protein [Rhodocyclaceae bacterium]|nr:fimbrial protein [Rhodocyclaceae bacterium]